MTIKIKLRQSEEDKKEKDNRIYVAYKWGKHICILFVNEMIEEGLHPKRLERVPL